LYAPADRLVMDHGERAAEEESSAALVVSGEDVDAVELDAVVPELDAEQLRRYERNHKHRRTPIGKSFPLSASTVRSHHLHLQAALSASCSVAAFGVAAVSDLAQLASVAQPPPAAA